jgi:hypothetical protein
MLDKLQASDEENWDVMRLRTNLMARSLGASVFMGLICLWAVQGRATETVCQKRAESLGWAIGCGCLKHDLATIQQSLPILLPACRLEDGDTLVNSVKNGLEESVDHDEYDLICMISCKTTNWHSINELLVPNEDGDSIWDR